MEKKLSKSQGLVLETLNNEEALTYEDVASMTGLSYDGVRGRISELTKMGYDIERIRDGSNIFLMYKKNSTYRRPADIKESISQKMKGIEDFYGITDFLDEIRNKKVKKSKNLNSGSPLEEDKYAALLLSDIHFGEIIKNSEGDKVLFDTDTAYERMENLTDETISVLKKNKINHLHILCLGDMIDGDSIYRNHLFRIEKPAIEQVQDAVKSITSAIKTIVSNKITVEMYTVRGNHGITNYQNVEEDNWDNVVYDMLDIVFMDNENVLIHNFKGSEGKAEIGERTIVLHHGGKLSAQIKTASGLREFRGLCGKHKLEDGDMIAVGHLHEFGVETDQGKFLIRNGSIADASEYALKLNLYSEPTQTLLIFKDDEYYPIIMPLNVM